MKLVLKSALFLALGLALEFGVTTSFAVAQLEMRGITVAGSASRSEKPEFLRMTMTIASKGADTKAAIESLKERKKQASIKLERLEAIEDSIEFGQVTMGDSSDGGGPSMQQMRRMMENNFGDSEEAEKLMAIQPPVSVSVTVTADWKMPDGDEEELLIAIQGLKDGIAEADVAGTGTPDELTPEQQELAAELAEAMNRYSSSDESEVGTPTFLFGRRFSQDEADQLMKEAFADARAKAEKLAAAASLELGSLVSLTSADAIRSDYDMYGYSGYGRPRRQVTHEKEEGVVIIVGDDPLEVTLDSSVHVAFEAK